MFKDGLDVTVSFLTELDSVVEISEVHGGGLMMKVSNYKTNAITSVALNHEELLKLGEILQEAEKYIKENK